MKKEVAYKKKIVAPYSIGIKDGDFVLLKNMSKKAWKPKIIKTLLAQSENGADREAAIFLGI